MTNYEKIIKIGGVIVSNKKLIFQLVVSKNLSDDSFDSKKCCMASEFVVLQDSFHFVLMKG
jgi:hypothetical protein